MANEFTDTNVTGSLGITGEVVVDERADHISTPTAGKGIIWVKNTTPSTLIFTDDAGTDATIGAAGATPTEFADDVFRIEDNSDDTKKLAFSVGGITTSTTRTITVPDADLDLGDVFPVTGTPDGSKFLRDDKTWVTPAGGGDVSKVGTPADGQVGVWTGDGTIEGDSALTFDTATDTLSTANAALTGDIVFDERADHASTPGAGKGYLWVKSDTPSSLIYTDDAGTDYDLTTSGSGDVSKVGTPVDGQIGVWTGDGTIEGDAALTFDTTDDTLVIGASGKLAFGAVDVLSDSAGTTTLANIDALDATTDTTVTSANMARVAGSTYSTIQHMQDIFHSTGVVAGGGITDDADGTITVAAGNGLIRATDSAVAQILWFDWSAENGANVALTDNDMNYVYVEYNSGTPQVIATITERTDLNTNVFLGTVYRAGTTLHVTENTRALVGDHALQMIERMKATMPFQRESGAILSGSGTRNIAVTAGAFWEGLKRFTTAALDTSVTGSFTAYYRDGGSGFTAVASQTQIDNTNYDDNSGTLAELTVNRYGVHWVYIDTEGDIFVVYGRGDYLLTGAEEEAVPTTVPPHFAESHTRLIGKIIVQKSASTFTSVQSAFETVLTLGTPTDHGELSGLTDDDHTQYLLVAGTRAMTGALDMGAQNITNVGTVDGVDVSARDHDAVTLGGTPDYITISGQVITRNAVDLAADITGTLPIANGGTGATTLAGASIPTYTSTNTFTNKRITPRTGSTSSSATPTINTDNVDHYLLTAQAADITSFTTNLSGTPTEGQRLLITITGTAARAITWGASFEAGAVALPTTTITTQRLDVLFIWNTVTSKWRCMAAGPLS